MTDEEAYVVQAYGGLLEFAMATYEGLMQQKRAQVGELRRHKSVIKAGFIEMGPTMLAACAHFGERQGHQRWRFNIRVQALLKDLLLHEKAAALVIDKYLHEQETYRERTIR